MHRNAYNDNLGKTESTDKRNQNSNFPCDPQFFECSFSHLFFKSFGSNLRHTSNFHKMARFSIEVNVFMK